VRVVHLCASTFLGGPERQLLGLAAALPPRYQSTLISFAEHGQSGDLVRAALARGIEAFRLQADTPHLIAAIREIRERLVSLRADVLCCHGYKADILGGLTARRMGVPAIAVSRGWTGENRRVQLYDFLDRRMLRFMDRVVCVSGAQAERVKRAGVRAERISVIHNAVEMNRFARPVPTGRALLRHYFPATVSRIVGAAGRLSPEKGFSVLVAAARSVLQADPRAGVIIFGDGVLRGALERQIGEQGLAGRCVLAGFRTDLDQLVPALDLMVLPSYTEGLPNIVLEALAASVPVVATAVGGTPEIIDDGVHGFLVPAGNATALARRILQVLRDEGQRRQMGARGRRRVATQFSFEAQSTRYQQLFETLIGATPVARRRVDEPVDVAFGTLPSWPSDPSDRRPGSCVGSGAD
jgi:glycosyltransferase involved in cell wall biosynthesis